MLLLTNILRGFYAVWEVEGQVAGVNLVSRDSFVVSRLEDIRSSMPSPQEYMTAKSRTTQSLPLGEMGLQGANWGMGSIPFPHKMCGWWPTDFLVHGDPWLRAFYCGPASATTIALWQRDADGDVGFPPQTLDERYRPVDRVKIFDGFNYHMWVIDGMTSCAGWRRGFREYSQSLNPPEDFTFEIRRPGTYWQIVSDIDHGWPLGLMGEMTGPPEAPKPKDLHWVAVKEYFWIGGSDYLVIVADTWWAGVSQRTAHRRFLCWNALAAGFLFWVVPVRDAD